MISQSLYIIFPHGNKDKQNFPLFYVFIAVADMGCGRTPPADDPPALRYLDSRDPQEGGLWMKPLV